MKRKLAIIGFGTVGQGLCEILLSRSEFLKSKYDFDPEIVAVCDKLLGSIFCDDGLDIRQLLDLVKSEGSIENYRSTSEIQRGWDALKTIQQSDADIICELTYTDIKTGQPAIDHCKTALESGKHVVTSNKGPAALRYKELTELALKRGVHFMIEGTVMSGTPVLNLARNEFAGNQISAIRGILNGTTNFILTNMEKGRSYDDVLEEAQKLGYAEADPTADVEGFDALAKVIILANVIMDASLSPDQVSCKGISHITLEDIEQARKENKRWKLIGEIQKDDNVITASVSAKKVDLLHPLAGVSGATNAITFSTDLLGDVTIIGAGAGKIETGFSILSDILEINNNSKEKQS